MDSKPVKHWVLRIHVSVCGCRSHDAPATSTVSTVLDTLVSSSAFDYSHKILFVCEYCYVMTN